MTTRPKSYPRRTTPSPAPRRATPTPTPVPRNIHNTNSSSEYSPTRTIPTTAETVNPFIRHQDSEQDQSRFSRTPNANTQKGSIFDWIIFGGSATFTIWGLTLAQPFIKFVQQVGFNPLIKTLNSLDSLLIDQFQIPLIAGVIGATLLAQSKLTGVKRYLVIGAGAAATAALVGFRLSATIIPVLQVSAVLVGIGLWGVINSLQIQHLINRLNKTQSSNHKWAIAGYVVEFVLHLAFNPLFWTLWKFDPLMIVSGGLMAEVLVSALIGVAYIGFSLLINEVTATLMLHFGAKLGFFSSIKKN